MHDSSTLAFEICVSKLRLVEIWHIDPCVNGDEDSCGWFFPRLSDDEMALAHSLIYDEYDNLRRWFEGTPDTDAVYYICQIFRIHKARTRPWWQHPRWHFWHWKVRVVPVEGFKRWAFSRCAYCGKRFPWGYSPVTTQWNGTGPRWFRSEEYIYHRECCNSMRRAKED